MHAMVSARVPVEIKNQGDRTLKELGATATDLINAAYTYVIEHNALPGAAKAERAEKPIVKALNAEQAETFRRQWSRCATLKSPCYDGSNFGELLDGARTERHARFA